MIVKDVASSGRLGPNVAWDRPPASRIATSRAAAAWGRPGGPHRAPRAHAVPRWTTSVRNRWNWPAARPGPGCAHLLGSRRRRGRRTARERVTIPGCRREKSGWCELRATPGVAANGVGCPSKCSGRTGPHPDIGALNCRHSCSSASDSVTGGRDVGSIQPQITYHQSPQGGGYQDRAPGGEGSGAKSRHSGHLRTFGRWPGDSARG